MPMRLSRFGVIWNCTVLAIAGMVYVANGPRWAIPLAIGAACGLLMPSIAHWYGTRATISQRLLCNLGLILFGVGAITLYATRLFNGPSESRPALHWLWLVPALLIIFGLPLILIWGGWRGLRDLAEHNDTHLQSD
jgi:hypothetical protein